MAEEKSTAGTDVIRDLACQTCQERMSESERRYRSLFDDAAIPLWEADFSAVKDYLDRLPVAEEELNTYLQIHPEAVRHAITLIKVLDVNNAFRHLYRIPANTQFFDTLPMILQEHAYAGVVVGMLAARQGKTTHQFEAMTRNLQGDPLHVVIRYAAAPGFEGTWRKIRGSMTDITTQKRLESELQVVRDGLEQNMEQRTAELNNVYQQLAALYDIAQTITASLRLDVVLHTIARSTAEIL